MKSIKKLVAASTVLFAVCIVASSSVAQMETTLHNFSGKPDGDMPYAGVIIDVSGNLYGTTGHGGTFGHGSVFKISPTGVETVLYSFKGGTDGDTPISPLARDHAGNLYGTTYYGGANGVGAVFKLTPGGVETVLHSFAQDGVDGYTPEGPLAMDNAGNLYGTATAGGANRFRKFGAIFKVTSAGTETVLHSFQHRDGCYSGAGLVLGKNNHLYGTSGSCGAFGHGTVFELAQNGVLTVLHNFGSYRGDASYTLFGVALDKSGNVYGSTIAGGAYGFGTIYEVATDGTETILHSFSAGDNPFAPVTLDNLGNVYGVTYGGRTVFKLDPSGALTTLYDFGNNSGLPSGVVLGKNNNLYGTMGYGGLGFGFVYKIH